MTTKDDPLSTGSLLQGLTGARNAAHKDVQRLDVDTFFDAVGGMVPTRPVSEAGIASIP